MIQKCSLIAVMNVFFKEPLNIHFIREIGREIGLSQSSVRNYVTLLEKNNFIIKKKAKPFDGYVANRDNEEFLFYKRAFNLLSLYDLEKVIIDDLHPKAVVLFGSYSRGEDVESSDVDLLVISKIKKEIDFSKIEKILRRKIHITFVNKIDDLDTNVKDNILSGNVIFGVIE